MSSNKILDTVKIHGKGRVQIPSSIRRHLHIEDGDVLIFYLNDKHEICIEKGYSLEKEKGRYDVTPYPY